MENRENAKIRDWYIKNFPTDPVGMEIDEDATFTTLYEYIVYGKEVYDIIPDSLIRERCFKELADICGCSYDVIYYTWLNSY